MAGKRAKLHLRLPMAPYRLHYCLNRPPLAVEKLSSMQLVPDAKKVGDRCSKALSHVKHQLVYIHVTY